LRLHGNDEQSAARAVAGGKLRGQHLCFDTARKKRIGELVFACADSVNTLDGFCVSVKLFAVGRVIIGAAPELKTADFVCGVVLSTAFESFQERALFSNHRSSIWICRQWAFQRRISGDLRRSTGEIGVDDAFVDRHAVGHDGRVDSGNP
jgi:hypothetical protein